MSKKPVAKIPESKIRLGTQIPPTVTEKPTQEELEAIYLHPDLKGPTNNEVGGDADPVTPGLQGSGAPGAVTGDNPFAIWAKNHKGLAEKVKPGQAGYEEIQKALGKTPSGVPASAYEGGTKLTDGEFEAPELKSDPKIDFDSGFNVSQDAKDFAAGAISAIKTSASSLQQPNFDGTTQPIGGIRPQIRSLYRISTMQTQILQKLWDIWDIR